MLDWRGWLNISQTTLALLIALVTVVSASVPRIVEVLTPKYSQTTLNVRQVNHQFLEVATWNQGNRNSQMTSAVLVAKTKDGKQLEPIQLGVEGLPSILAGQQFVMNFMIPRPEVAGFLALPHKEINDVILKARIAEFGKDAEDRSVDLPIGIFRLFCRVTEDADNQLRHPGQLADPRLTSHCL